MSKRFALHVGLNTVDTTKYTRKYRALRNAENDAVSFHSITKSGYDNTTILKGEDATSYNLIKSISQYATNMDSSDFLFITYSGHGSRIKDISNEEEDKYDEVLVLFDRLFFDDEFKACWLKFKKGTRILLMNDSCFNGTISRLWEENEKSYKTITEDDIKRGVYYKEAQAEYAKAKDVYNKFKTEAVQEQNNRSAVCSIINIAGCQDKQYASDGTSIMKNGLFTSHVLSIINEGAFNKSLKLFFDEVRRKMPPIQTPNWDPSAGVNDRAFEDTLFLSLIK